jgi:hypothetical protein
MAYTTIDDPTAFFNTLLYTGNGASSHAISGVGFQPDWTWNKNRSGDVNHALTDSVRGAPKRLMSQSDEAEINQTTGLLSFNSDGFTVGSDSGYNGNGNSMVSWNWKAGTSFTNDASSTSIGSIDSAGSVNDTAGFSIVSFTGTGSNGTIKHGLSTAPDLFIIKRRDADNDWRIGSSALTNFVKHVNLNTTAAQSDLAAAFNSTGPTTSVFSVGTSVSTNADGGTYIAYCFSSIKGYSKIGSYMGNGNADGPFIWTGFKPAFTLIKRTDSSTGGSWILFDNKRGNNVRNPVDVVMAASNNQSEANWGNAYDCDYLSNGFKWRMDGTGGYNNTSGATYIYMAFAEAPLVNSNGVPNNAR